MNCYNGERYLKKSIKSILKQSYKHWELIFFDNKSLDNSKKIFLEFKDKRLKYFYSKKNLKLYRARNQAIKKSKGHYVCFLDTDDFWHKDKLREQITFFKKNKNIEFCYTNFFYLKKKKKFFSNKNIENKIISTQKLLNNYDIGILTVMLNKSLLKKYKFKDNLEIIGDFDLFITLSFKYELGYLKKSLATYRIHDHNLSKERLDIHIDELKNWLKKKKLEKKFKNLSLKRQEFNLKILQVKNILTKKSFLSFRRQS
jgi:teichuronic acid biosynthesis glycosyltransferase TuaG